MPVLVVGCDGLKKRCDNTLAESGKLSKYADGMLDQLQVVERAVDGTVLRFEELKARQLKYQARLLQVMRRLETLRARGLPLSAMELRYREYLDGLSASMKDQYDKSQSLETSHVGRTSLRALYRQKTHELYVNRASLSGGETRSWRPRLCRNRTSRPSATCSLDSARVSSI